MQHHTLNPRHTLHPMVSFYRVFDGITSRICSVFWHVRKENTGTGVCLMRKVTMPCLIVWTVLSVVLPMKIGAARTPENHFTASSFFPRQNHGLKPSLAFNSMHLQTALGQVGRVNIAGYRQTRHCTGTLVGLKLVLTAAHCLYDKNTQRFVSPKRVFFVLGDQRHPIVSAPAKTLLPAKGFDGNAPLTLKT